VTLALIQPVEWMPVVHCDVCEQSMPADHRTHITTESGTAPGATGAAPDPQKEIQP
jgi:hypothetical protein